MTHPLDGTPDALVSESNSVKTKALLWCVGATAGSRMMSTNVPMICHTVEVPFQRARKRVGRKLMSACRNRMTAGHSQQAFRVPRPPRGLSLGHALDSAFTLQDALAFTCTCIAAALTVSLPMPHSACLLPQTYTPMMP